MAADVVGGRHDVQWWRQVVHLAADVEGRRGQLWWALVDSTGPARGRRRGPCRHRKAQLGAVW